MPQKSSALDRARAFLPAMAAANQQLSGQAPGSLDIEALDPSSTQHIELDLSCGLYDLRDSAAQTAAAQATGFSACTRPRKKVKRRQ